MGGTLLLKVRRVPDREIGLLAQEVRALAIGGTLVALGVTPLLLRRRGGGPPYAAGGEGRRR